jgi:tRNA pseudouridine55 synthase
VSDLAPINGVIVIDKPAGVTSARVVDRVKRLLPRGTKVGHAGTLDPFATGVLVLLIGNATKLCESMMDQPKAYEAKVKLGATTETDDPESPEQVTANVRPPDRAAINAALEHFRGTVMQRPPAYSAIKVAGRRAYDLARGGEQVALEARPVNVYRIEVLTYAFPVLELAVECGRGTYVRSIARDLGERLGTGAYLTKLRRTRVGTYTTDDALPLDALQRETILTAVRPAQ